MTKDHKLPRSNPIAALLTIIETDAKAALAAISQTHAPACEALQLRVTLDLGIRAELDYDPSTLKVN